MTARRWLHLIAVHDAPSAVESVFGDAVDLLSAGVAPEGVTEVATTLAEPGPMQVPLEIHPTTCGFLRRMDPIDCTCGYYHLVSLGKR